MRGSSGAPVTSHDAVSRHSVRRHLRIEIDAYDRTIRRFIPGYDAMVEAAAGAIAAAGAQAVVDLGAGTGALSEAILSRSGTTAVELIDVDPEMLAQARRRLARFGRRARFREASFLAPLPPCGGAAAALALHHVPALDDKRALYRRVHDALHPGGLFVNADAAVPADPAARAATYDAWADHMASCGIERTRAFEHFEEWAEEDAYFPLEEELAAMRAAGFDAACVWRRGPMAVVAGRKAARPRSAGRLLA